MSTDVIALICAVFLILVCAFVAWLALKNDDDDDDDYWGGGLT